jgi:hypothetical protein
VEGRQLVGCQHAWFVPIKVEHADDDRAGLQRQHEQRLDRRAAAASATDDR